MSLLIVTLAVAAGIGLFVLGLVAGTRLAQSWNTGNESEHFSEAIKLWRRIDNKIDELTRRNVVELGSVRERLNEMTSLMRNSRIANVIEGLTEQVQRLEGKVVMLDDRIERSRGDGHGNDPKSSLSFDSVSASESAGDHRLERKSFSFDDFVSELSERAELGASLSNLLDFIYNGMREFVPCQRMGYAEIDYEADLVSAVWHRSERPVRLKVGYSARLSKSSLRFVAEQNRPRVLNCLPDYLQQHPNSRSTRLLVDEGFGSSLTFPVAVNDTVIGFFFLTSVNVDGFDDSSVPLAREVVTQISCVASLEQEILFA